MKKKVPKKDRNLSPIRLDWGSCDALREAKILSESGDVRAKFLTHSPDDIFEETDTDFLHRLWELYFPSDQPHNAYEEAFLLIMRECIDARLAELSL